MHAPKDYVARMDRTVDTLTEAVRDDNKAYRAAGTIIGLIYGKFVTGIAIGCGIAVGMAIARAGVGL